MNGRKRRGGPGSACVRLQAQHDHRGHLVANRDLAIATGVHPDHIPLAEDGVVVDLVDGRARIVGAVPCGYVYVDGSSVGEAVAAVSPRGIRSSMERER